MNSKEFYISYKIKKEQFHKYIDKIKQKSPWDLYTIINTTLIKNPYATSFHLDYIASNFINKKPFWLFFVKNTLTYYRKYYYFLFVYFIQYILFNIFNKRTIDKNMNSYIGIDIFLLVKDILRNNKFEDHYFQGLYEELDKNSQPYFIIARLYGVNEKISSNKDFINFIKFLNKNDKNNKIILEHQFLSILDFIELFYIITIYPFKTLRLLQRSSSDQDNLFNYHLINDMLNVEFKTFSRYIFAKNISKISLFKKIYSWCEFQSIERSFNFGIRLKSNKIQLIGCQFYINHETYFNTYIDDIDFDMKSSPHKVLVNGNYYVLKRDKVSYGRGVSFRYVNLFNIKQREKADSILILGSFNKKETLFLLDICKHLDSIVFKSHPSIDINSYSQLPENIIVSEDNIYELFKNTKLVICSASGTSVEAVACGLSVIIIASQDNLTANPLIEYGQGKIWDIAFNKDDIEILLHKLMKYRENNQKEINEISSWYKENFFIEPTEKNIKDVFEL